MENFAPMMAAVLALMGTPGPVTLASAASGAAYGRRAFPYVVALTAGTFTVIVLVAAGVTGLVETVPGAAPVITALAGAYILYLAYRIATAPPLGELDRSAGPPPLIGAYAMAVANPKAWGAMGALFSGFDLLPGDPVTGGVLKAAMLGCFALTINTTWMIGGAALARVLRDPVASRGLNLFFAVLLVLSILTLVL